MQIRVAEEKDAAALVEIYSYYVEKTAITFEYETPSTEEFTERIHNIKEKYPYIVAKRTDKPWLMPMALPFIQELLMGGAPKCPSM